jgi:hypothetical protein
MNAWRELQERRPFPPHTLAHPPRLLEATRARPEPIPQEWTLITGIIHSYVHSSGSPANPGEQGEQGELG